MDEDAFDLLTLDEIADALRRRFDAVLVVGVRSMDDDREERMIVWRGGRICSLGLAQFAIGRITHDDDVTEYE